MTTRHYGDFILDNESRASIEAMIPKGIQHPVHPRDYRIVMYMFGEDVISDGKWTEKEDMYECPIQVTPVNVTVMTIEATGSRALILELKSDLLDKRHAIAMKMMHKEQKKDKPFFHITLSYDYKGSMEPQGNVTAPIIRVVGERHTKAIM